jgi:CDP-diacylglycerol--glycerol-3-phosphate 3-phosphatidyltransferase
MTVAGEPVGQDVRGVGELQDVSGAPQGERLPEESFLNIPNIITLIRISVVPILLFLPLMMSPAGSRFLAWLFIVAAVTDLLDGWIARQYGMVTKIGKLLDPLADKLLIATALIMLLAVGRLPTWSSVMVVVIVGRELAVTGLRGIASADGHIVAASGAGKLKTLSQNAAVASLLFHYETYGVPCFQVGLTLLGVASALTLWSGWMYFASYFGWRGNGAAPSAPAV